MPMDCYLSALGLCPESACLRPRLFLVLRAAFVEVGDPCGEVCWRACAIVVLVAFWELVVEGVDPCGEVGGGEDAVVVGVGGTAEVKDIR